MPRRTREEQRELDRAKQQERFLKELRRRANVSAAARKAKVGRRTAYDWYKADPDFAKAWDDALEEAVDGLEEAAWRRARDGTLKPVYQQGRKVGQIREYSDTLTVTLLKAHRPEKYRERQQHELTGPNGAPLETGLPDLSSLTTEELQAFHALLRKARDHGDGEAGE